MLFDPAQQIQQIVTIDIVDGPPTKRWQDVFIEDS